MKKLLLTQLIGASLLITGHTLAADRCYKVTSIYTGTGTPGTAQIRPGEGLAASWSGACDSCNGSLNLPATINVNGAGVTIPYLDRIAVSNNIPFTTYGDKAGYAAERVFARCHPNVDVYEAYSTNGDNDYGGRVGADTWGIANGYPTAWQKIAIVITNNESGQPFTSTWQQRLLNDPNKAPLDKDSTGYNLVKAKNLTDITVELFLINKTSGGWWGNAHRRYTYTQPNGYIALQAPGLSQINIGQPHAGGNWNGWHGEWPGAIGLYLNTELRFTPTCIIRNNTPYINFPNITANQLNTGSTLNINFNVTTECDAGAVSQTTTNGTTIGFLIDPTSVAKTQSLNLLNSVGGASHIISTDYDNPIIAKGVGVRILRGTTALNLLTDQESVVTNANNQGWYTVLPTAGNINSAQISTQTFTARLEKLPNQTATTGAFTATAQIVLRLQ